MPKEKIILFDGVCNLCNSAVQFIIRHDKNAVFAFAALQSDAGARILSDRELPVAELTSIIFVDGDKIYTSSTAALNIARELSGAIKLLYGFIIVPRFIRDAVYRFIARHRYRWFGKRDSCMIPTPALLSRFLK